MMNTEKLNEWLQIAASAGVIVGLLLVAYEVRQSNVYASAEAVRSSISGWQDISVSEYETDIANVYVKSFEDPGNLTQAELFKLNAWLTAIVNQYERHLAMHDLGFESDPTQDLTNWANAYFGNHFGRAWLEENRNWIDPRNYAAIERGLESTDESVSSSYYERLKSKVKDRPN